MRITLVGPFGLSPKGTMSARALPLARALARRGHVVQMILPPWDAPADAGRAWEDAGVLIQCLTLKGVRRPRASLRLAWRGLSAVRAARPDVLYCFKPIGYAGLIGLLSRLLPRRPALLFDLDDLEGRRGWAARISRHPAEAGLRDWQERWALRRADALTVASHALHAMALAAGVPGARLQLVLNGCAPADPPVGTPAWLAERQGARARFALPPDEPAILWPARPDEVAPGRCAEIMARVWAARPATPLLVAGGAPADFPGPAISLGWLTPADWQAAVLAADVGLALLDDTPIQRARCPARLPQMLAWGLPLVVEAVGEAKTYVEDGLTGRLVAAGDAAGCAAALLDLLADAERRSALRRAAAQRAPQRWAWELQAQLAERACLAALAQRG